MKPINIFFLFLLIILSLSFVSASEGFENKMNQFVVEMKNNFSLSDVNIHLRFVQIEEESAQSIRDPFRGYLISIDESKLQNASDFQLKGLLAHEISHLETYSKMNLFQLGIYGVKYLFSSSFRRNVERATDTQAVKNGFGRELKAFREFRLATGSEHDKEFLIENYLSPEEISNLISSQGI